MIRKWTENTWSRDLLEMNREHEAAKYEGKKIIMAMAKWDIKSSPEFIFRQEIQSRLKITSVCWWRENFVYSLNR